MPIQHRRRLEALEATTKAKEPPAPERTPLEALLFAIRDGMITFDGQWLARVYYCQPLAEALNEQQADQPGSLVVALQEEEFAEASAALEAGRFAFVRNYPPYDRFQPKDSRTGTPFLCAAPGESDAISRLAHHVYKAAQLVYFQTKDAGGKMPASLAEFGEWLRALQPYAIHYRSEVAQ